MRQPEPSSHNVIPETPDNPTGSNSFDVSINNNINIPRVGIEILLGIALESSSEDEYEERLSGEENVNNDDDNNDGPVNKEPPVDYGFEDDFIGDSHFTLYSRRHVNLLKGWRAILVERRKCAGFLVPEPRIPERINLVLRAISGVSLLLEKGGSSCGSFGAWANSEIREGLRDLAARGGFLDLD